MVPKQHTACPDIYKTWTGVLLEAMPTSSRPRSPSPAPPWGEAEPLQKNATRCLREKKTTCDNDKSGERLFASCILGYFRAFRRLPVRGLGHSLGTSALIQGVIESPRKRESPT